MKGKDLSSLKILGTVGEPINEEAWHWYDEHIGKGKCPIVDTWWQTETGGCLISNMAGITPSKPSWATLPMPGVQPILVDENGKEVTVLVELRARFDEQNNIRWANYLQEEGVKVTFGLPGLKVHSKLIVVSRLEGSVERKYAHVGTGNFNEKTANLYSDISLLTCDPKITNEVNSVILFWYYEGG